jgi:transcriptional regulator with PAS, ATPase and Fis domain
MDKKSKSEIGSIAAIKFTIKYDQIQSESVELDARSGGSFKENMSGFISSTVCVVDTAHLETLRSREFQDVIDDCGKKAKAQSLTRYFRASEKIPILEVEYSSAGKARSSVEIFLGNASGADSHKLSQASVLGIPQTVLHDLLKTVGKSVEGNNRDEETFTLLQRLKADQNEPEELKEAFIGCSEDAQLVRQYILRASESDIAVLILGDTGTGKEIVARKIHQYSHRGDKPIVTVNCAAISPRLLELELFGCKPGVLESRHPGKIGLWEEADGSTLFLDEIGDLAIDHQTKILRALQEGSFKRVGDNEDISVDVRIIAATNRDVFSMTRNEDFREDLYYRLRGFVIRTLPLREHPEDIPMLAQAFWKTITGKEVKSLPEEILKRLKTYNWPGNARDLKLVLSNLRTLYPNKANKGELKIVHLEDAFRQTGHEDCGQNRLPFTLEPKVIRIESLRHLTRIFDVLYATQIAALHFAKLKRLKREDIEDLQTALELRRQELEIFCKHDKLFNRKVLFLQVFNILGMLMVFQTELFEDPEKARDNWLLELREKFHEVISAVSEEINMMKNNA